MAKNKKNKKLSNAESTFPTTIELKTFRGIKTQVKERINLELTVMIIMHNVIKITAKSELIKHRRSTIDMIDELQGNFIEKNIKNTLAVVKKFKLISS